MINVVQEARGQRCRTKDTDHGRRLLAPGPGLGSRLATITFHPIPDVYEGIGGSRAERYRTNELQSSVALRVTRAFMTGAVFSSCYRRLWGVRSGYDLNR